MTQDEELRVQASVGEFVLAMNQGVQRAATLAGELASVQASLKAAQLNAENLPGMANSR